ncbi:MAG: hypothetical protein ABI623_02030 [bacterium]
MKKWILAFCFVCLWVGCSKNEPATEPAPAGPTLTVSRNSVQLGSGETQSVIIGGGTPAYTITTIPNALLASARLENATADSTTLIITGAVSSATGTTPVAIRDNSTTPKQVSISITKR